MPTNNNNSCSEFEEVFFKLFRLMKDDMGKNLTMQISNIQMHALMFLKNKQPVQMSEIAEYFGVEKPTATSLLDKLVDLKFVKRKQDKKDRRVVHIVLTENGEKILEEAIKERNRKFSLMLSYLSQNDQKNLLKILKQLIANIEESHEK
ncbi:MAG TPA: MarR family transcriptional regulator [Patescibacteria group bacterium]|nr:MarR family transcriptional regulator [Patescibacteria group bacterium]